MEKNCLILSVVVITCLGSYSVHADQYKASAPQPAHAATGIDPAAVLQWKAPELVIGPEYEVYFSTDPNFPSGPVGPRQTEAQYDPYGDDDMDILTEYFWRVDVYDPNEGGIPTTVKGELWSFFVPLAPGLVAYYDYEDDPNDLSGNEHHGVFRGEAKIVVDDIRGKVLSLDGSGDYMNLINAKTAADLGIDGNSAKSMTAWVYTRSFNGGGIFDVGSHSNGQEFSLRTLSSPPDKWRIQYFGGDYDIDFIYDSLNKWVHFALVHDGVFTRMYVNGILIGEANRLLNTSGNDDFRVGQYGSTGFDGLIDDFALWNKALSQEDIYSIMPAGDINANGTVDNIDLKALTDDWLTDNIIPSVHGTVTLEDSESYSPGDFGDPYSLQWFQYLTDCSASSGTPSLITGDPNSPQGNKALRFDFNYPASCGGSNNWIMAGRYYLPALENPSRYDQLRFWARNHEGNTGGNLVWEMHFASDLDLIRIGPFSTTLEPGVWREFVIDLRQGYNVNWGPFSNLDDVPFINAMVVTTISNLEHGQAGHVTIDIDDIRLVDTADCSYQISGDLNGDCIVDFIDFAILSGQWMSE